MASKKGIQIGAHVYDPLTKVSGEVLAIGEEGFPTEEPAFVTIRALDEKQYGMNCIRLVQIEGLEVQR
jgi:hypothetical protein